MSSDNVSKAGAEDTNGSPAGDGHRLVTPGFLVTFSILLFAIAVLRGPLIFWRLEGRAIAPAGSYLAVAAAGMLLVGLFLRGKRHSAYLSLPACAAALLVVALSDWLCHSYSFFQAPSIRGELFVTALASFLVIRYSALRVFPIAAAAAACLLFWSFLQQSGGNVVFSDDHPSVFYRLVLLKEHFPWIPLYNPDWNAGTDARDFFSTGILNLFFLGWPLIRAFPVDEIYNLLVAGVLFVLLPASVFVAGRSLLKNSTSAGIAAGLALATGLPWYRWALKYGSMGFVASTALIPLNFALVLALLDDETELSRTRAVLLGAALTLMLFWSPTGLVFIPTILFALLRMRTLLRRRDTKIILGLVLICTASWMAIWVRAANVLQFVAVSKNASFEGRSSAGEEAGTEDDHSEEDKKRVLEGKRRGKGNPKGASVKSVVHSVRSFAINSNPTLLFLGLPAVLLIPSRRRRALFAATALWLAILGIVVAPLKPQLELDRMLVILWILLTLPAAHGLSRLLSDAARKEASFALRILASVAAGFYLTGFASASAVVRNRTLERYSFSDRTVSSMADAIHEYGGEGRVVFSGFVLHELNNGHLAPLAYYTKHPLVASSPVHNTWWYTDIIPEHYRDAGPAGVEQFLDLMNATAVMAHEPFWRRYFAEQPERYRYVWEGGRFKMFTRIPAPGGYFIEGSGEVLSQEGDAVVLKMSSADAVIKFRYFPFLQSTSCRLEPYALPDLELIRLRDCAPGEIVRITAKTGLKRALS